MASGRIFIFTDQFRPARKVQMQGLSRGISGEPVYYIILVAQLIEI